MKLTVKKICNEVANRHNLEPDSVELHRHKGVWYWCGRAPCLFESTMIGHINLNDWTIDLWLEDFDANIKRWSSLNGEASLREYINSTQMKN